MNPQHRTLQRRLQIAAMVIVALVAVIAVPLTVNDNLRLEMAIRTGIAPGRSAEHLTGQDDGALLIVLPLDNGAADGPNPWLYRAQFIAWPSATGLDLQHLDTDERVELPLESIAFSSNNADGSLVLLRGPLKDGSGDAAFTIAPETMTAERLASADATPDSSGDWDTPTWAKTKGSCNRPSPHKLFVGCFTRAGTSSYLAGDWQLDLQIWGDFEEVTPLVRGRGFLPWVGFAENDTVVYLQNEYGILRIAVPDSVQEQAPAPTGPSTPVAFVDHRDRLAIIGSIGMAPSR